MEETSSLSDEKFVSRLTSVQLELRSFILAMVPRDGDSYDILQEVNLSLWRKRARYDQDKDFLKWAFGFAVVEARRFQSRSSNSRLWFSEETINLLAEDWHHADSFMEDCEDALGVCLGKLREKERQVIDARYGKRLSVKQIAVNTDKPVSTVYKILNRSLKALRSCIKHSQIQTEQT